MEQLDYTNAMGFALFLCLIFAIMLNYLNGKNKCSFLNGGHDYDRWVMIDRGSVSYGGVGRRPAVVQKCECKNCGYVKIKIVEA